MYKFHLYKDHWKDFEQTKYKIYKQNMNTIVKLGQESF